MDEIENTEITEDINFGKEIAKSVVYSAAATVGTLAGFVVFGLAVDKVQKIKANRAAKKAAQTEED
jgi:hypothetical protein